MYSTTNGKLQVIYIHTYVMRLYTVINYTINCAISINPNKILQVIVCNKNFLKKPWNVRDNKNQGSIKKKINIT